MRLFAIRHPPTEWNMQGIAQGHADSPLTKEGRAAALELGRQLNHRNIARIHTSDLGRCIETTELANRSLALPVVSSSQLREQNLGIFNATAKIAIKQAIADKLENEAFTPENGESLRDVQRRVLRYASSLPDETALLVTHTGCIRSLIAAALDCSITDERTRTSHLTITEFTYENGRLKIADQGSFDPKDV